MDYTLATYLHDIYGYYTEVLPLMRYRYWNPLHYKELRREEGGGGGGSECKIQR